MTKTLSSPRVWHVVYNGTAVLETRCSAAESSWVHLKEALWSWLKVNSVVMASGATHADSGSWATSVSEMCHIAFECVSLHTLLGGGIIAHFTEIKSMIYLSCDQKTCLQRVLCNRFHNNSNSSAVMLRWKLAKEVISVALCNLNHMRAVKWFMRFKHLDDWLEVKAFLLDFPKQLEFKIYFTCSLVSTTLWTPVTISITVWLIRWSFVESISCDYCSLGAIHTLCLYADLHPHLDNF